MASVTKSRGLASRSKASRRPARRAAPTSPLASAHALLHPELRDGTLAGLEFFDALGSMSRETFPGWRQAMAQFARPWRDDVPVERRIVAAAKRHRVPVFVINSRPGSRRPVIVHMHGGGFVAGGAEYDVGVLQETALALDCTVVSVEYRLAPEHGWKDSLADNYAALDWVHAHAVELGVDPQRIAVMGESAGGGHAALLAIEARNRGKIPLALQVLVYPMLDDRTGTSRPSPPHIGTMVWSRESNRFGWKSFLGVTPGGTRVPRAAVPARVRNLAGLAPAYISVGGLDLFFEEDLDYARRLNAAGVPTELHVVPGAVHGFDEFSPDASLVRLFTTSKLDALRRAFATGGQ